MIFRRVVMSAFLVGICAGIFLSIVQMWQVIPIIANAEMFEINEAPEPNPSLLNPSVENKYSPDHQHQGQSLHSHSSDVWSPEDGRERVFYTVVSNIMAAMGFSLILISAMAFVQKNISLMAGLIWGLAGFAVFFVAPSIGLTPEIPGMAAADLNQRQYWWLLTVGCTAGGLFCVVFLKSYQKVFGLLLIAIPHLAGAPIPLVDGFSNTNTAVVALLEQLEEKFIRATAIANGVYWLLLGVLSAITVKKFVRPIRG